MEGHEEDGGKAEGYADDHAWGDGLQEEQCADEDGCYGLKHSQDSSTGGADVTGGYGKGEQGNHGGEYGQAGQVDYGFPRVYTIHE